jgi:hypothetical protein
MTKLTRYIRSAYPGPLYHRPFVCDGRPEACNVIVIGENPATKMEETDWWSFWDDDSGFDFKKFESEYKQSRLKRGKKSDFSPTRKRLNILRENGLRTLETNAFSNERPDGHGQGVSNRELLTTLIANLPHLVGVIAHGEHAKRSLDSLTLPSHLRVYKGRHFRLEKYSNVGALAQKFSNLTD